jgi:hypothetical protein
MRRHLRELGARLYRPGSMQLAQPLPENLLVDHDIRHAEVGGRADEEAELALLLVQRVLGGVGTPQHTTPRPTSYPPLPRLLV